MAAARFLARPDFVLAANNQPSSTTGEDFYSTRVMAAGEGRLRRRGTARGSSVAAAGGGAAAAAPIVQTPHHLLSIGRSTRRSSASNCNGMATHRTHTRPSNNNTTTGDALAGYTSVSTGRAGLVAVAGAIPTLPESANQRSSPTDYTNNNKHTDRWDRAGPSSINTMNISNTSGSQGAQRVARYSRDTKCSCESCTLRSSGNASIKKWQDSDAKAHLRDLLLSNKQHKYWNDPPARVYDDNKPLFHLYKYENFSNNLRSLKKGITSEQENVDFDEAALDRESIAFPRGQITNHGNPFYDTSETKKLLVGLAKEGKLEQYKHHPSILMETNPIFHEYSGKVFAKAVNREKRRVKETVGWQMKRNIQGSKKHNAKYDKVQTAGE